MIPALTSGIRDPLLHFAWRRGNPDEVLERGCGELLLEPVQLADLTPQAIPRLLWVLRRLGLRALLCTLGSRISLSVYAPITRGLTKNCHHIDTLVLYSPSSGTSNFRPRVSTFLVVGKGFHSRGITL